MTERKPFDAFAIMVMLVLCVLWGLQQVAVKVAAPHMGPTMQLGVGFGVLLLHERIDQALFIATSA